MDGFDMMNDLLCDELLGEILGRFEDVSSYRNVCLVCKRWLVVQRRVKNVLGLCLPARPFESSYETFVGCLLSQFPQLQKLSLASDQLQTDAALSDSLLERIGEFCRFLRELKFSFGSVNTHGLKALALGCRNLTKMELTDFSPDFLTALSEMKALKALTLVLSGHGTRETYSMPVVRVLQLERLRLIGIGAGYKGLDWLWKSCHKLKNLEFRSCEGLGVSNVSSFVVCLSRIEELKLRRCRTIANAVLLRAAEYSKNLSSLVFYDGGDAEGLHASVRGCRNLKFLDLRLPLDLGNEDLAVIAENGKSLRSLSLHSCWLASGEGIKSLVPGLKYLEELILVRCRAAVQEPGTLTTLCQQLRFLKRLDLSDNDCLVDKELITMLPSCENLTSLRLWRCRRLTDFSMFSITQRCWMLESLDIARCDCVSADAASTLIINCHRLRQLVVERFKICEGSKRIASSKKITILSSDSSVYKRDTCAYEQLWKDSL
eukprot:TRINITY_DN2766_c0_g1_i1.p1 TRINITY_DN2766_c0_g1~~TRINITY_DN2766_c0_g1_i1.p1  ORF type:complete len:489 (-),score=57.32 TRINITY_DN2766_c0_g1_i1:37-1503(-)